MKIAFETLPLHRGVRQKKASSMGRFCPGGRWRLCGNLLFDVLLDLDEHPATLRFVVDFRVSIPGKSIKPRASACASNE